MKITDVKTNIIYPRKGLIVFASLRLNGVFAINGIGIHKKRNGQGYRLSYATGTSAKQNHPICNPVCPKLSADIEAAIFIALKFVTYKDCKNDRHDCH